MVILPGNNIHAGGFCLEVRWNTCEFFKHSVYQSPILLKKLDPVSHGSQSPMEGRKLGLDLPRLWNLGTFWQATQDENASWEDQEISGNVFGTAKQGIQVC